MKLEPEVCRAWREHLWQHIETEQFDHGRSRFLIALKECPRCETMKSVWINRSTGKRIKAPYAYPKGYLRKGVKNPQRVREQERLAMLEAQVRGKRRRKAA